LDDVCRHFDIEGYGHDQLEDTFLRRSTRQRKFFYHTFNQSEMLDEHSVESAERDKPVSDEVTEGDQQQQQQLDVHPPSDADVT